MTSVALRLWVAMMMSMSSAPQTRPASPRPSTVRVIESIDLGRYAGRWFEIARLPNKAQSVCAADVTVHFALRADGRLDMITRCRNGAGATIDTRGLARKVAKGVSDGQLQVRVASQFRSMFGRAWTDYWILGVGPDYTWAVAGSPSRDRLWILSRTPEMSTSSYGRALAIASGNGFDVGQLVKSPQESR